MSELVWYDVDPPVSLPVGDWELDWAVTLTTPLPDVVRLLSPEEGDHENG